RTLRIVDEIESEARPVASIAQRVEALQTPDRAFEDALTALPVDIVGKVAWQRGHDLDLLSNQENRKVLLASHFQDSEIAAIDDPDAEIARGPNQPPEVRVEFGRSPGDVERGDRAVRQHRDHAVDGLARHLLRAVRARTHVAVHAGLIAAV